MGVRGSLNSIEVVRKFVSICAFFKAAGNSKKVKNIHVLLIFYNLMFHEHTFF